MLKPFFIQMNVLSTFLNNKSNDCGWNDAKFLFMCYFICQAQKNTISRGYNLIFNSFVKSDMVAKMAPLLVTSQASSSAATDKIYLILLRRSKAVHSRQNRFEILQHIKNSREGSHQPPPPPLNVLRWGYEFACMSELLTLWLMCLGYLNSDPIQK